MLAGLNTGVISYSIIAIGFSLLCVLLLTCWKGRLGGVLFVMLCLVSATWAFASAYAAQYEYPISLIVILLELFRNLIWAILLIRLISLLNPECHKSPLFQLTKKLVYAIPVFLILLIIVLNVFAINLPALGYELRVLGQVFISIAGLALVEQIFRYTKNEQRWAFKFFCFGIGAFYVYDFYLYSDALLFGRIDYALWFARPWVYVVGLVLIYVAISRNATLDSKVSVSRSVVFYTTAIILTGLYLLIMSAGGFYLRQFGGNWGEIAFVSFIFSGLIFLVILMFSGSIRARIRVFIDKHFLDYKYDYREEWLGLIRELSVEDQTKKIEDRALHAMTEMMDSPGGSLWVKGGSQNFTAIAHVGMEDTISLLESGHSSLTSYLENWQWVVNLQEYQSEPSLYEGLSLPDWLEEQANVWLVVPLMLQAKLYGFVIILKPRAEKEFNWEDIDLLKTAGRQVAIHLAQQRSALALAQARQFEAFNRFSAYVVHDLKNLVSQLALVVKNAEKHKHNPAFMDDAIKTVDNSVDRMNRLLAQLRAGTVENQSQNTSKLSIVLQQAIKEKALGHPVPQLEIQNDELTVNGDEARLISIFGHIIQNAQDATPGDGKIVVTLSKEGDNALVVVRDTGSGMDNAFIEKRLFKPFDSTKGLTGMGIGAHESKSYIEELGGSLTVTSEVNKGSEFSARLPLF